MWSPQVGYEEFSKGFEPNKNREIFRIKRLAKFVKFVTYTKVWLYIEFLFHIFYYFWSKASRSLYQGLCCIEVC